MSNASFCVPKPYNEPVRAYLPGSPERASLKAELAQQSEQVVRIPLIIGGKEIWTETEREIVMPHDHGHVLAKYCVAGEKELRMAIDAALNARAAWRDMPWEHRAALFLKCADLLSGPWRDRVNAATMLGQSKTAYQAEIDSACELSDFFRFNTFYAQEIFGQQPESAHGVWNRQVYRPLDGFVAAVTPFNFTSIGGNLPSAPAVMGNVVLWKPASTAVLSNYYVMKMMMEAGLPDGVINFIPCRGVDLDEYVLSHPLLAGFHFTGSTEVFKQVWRTVGENIGRYVSYPRLVGETGGKDFIFAHPTADVEALSAACVRGAFEYQGQKCSAASRAFIPASLWGKLKEKLLAQTAAVKQGDVKEFDTFLSAVIDKSSFDKIAQFIDLARESDEAEVLCGGYDGSKGYFIYPTIIQALTPDFVTMKEELFGPVLTIYVYEDERLDETLKICDSATDYALTGAIFASDRDAIVRMEKALEDCAGNFYINDKPTGAVVGQQPFGGARASGTNDKAGSALNLYRWCSPRTIKETFVPSHDINYPYMTEA